MNQEGQLEDCDKMEENNNYFGSFKLILVLFQY